MPRNRKVPGDHGEGLEENLVNHQMNQEWDGGFITSMGGTLFVDLDEGY